MQILDKGAEATIMLSEDKAVKSRLSKGYRLKEIDDKLRKFRTRREAKVLETLQKLNFPAPKLISSSDESMEIHMELLKGKKLKEVLETNSLEYSKEIGRKIGILHSKDIIHGDLTTSNMILDNEIKFIDFGLSFFSAKIEDKAVDLHLLRQALESKHYKVWEECFNEALEGYKETMPAHSEVLSRLKEVELRGRNKH